LGSLKAFRLRKKIPKKRETKSGGALWNNDYPSGRAQTKEGGKKIGVKSLLRGS